MSESTQKAVHIMCWRKKRENEELEGPPSPYHDISDAVESVDFSASIGKFPSLKMDLISSLTTFGEELIVGAGEHSVERGDEIIVTEVTHDNYLDYIKTHEFPDARIVLMRGMVTDMMYSRGPVSETVSITVESPLIELDTTLTQEVLDSRASGFSSAPVVTSGNPTVPNPDEVTQEANFATLEERVIRDYTTLSKTVKDRGITVAEMREDPKTKKKTVAFKPWPLLRLILCRLIDLEEDARKRNVKTTHIDPTKLGKRVDRVKKLLYAIDDIESLKNPNNGFLIMKKNEYIRLVRTTMVAPLTRASGQRTSLWRLIVSVLNDLHMFFTPMVMFSAVEESETGGLLPTLEARVLGGFRGMNPYREPTTLLTERAIEFFTTKIPGYDAIIKSVGFVSNQINPKYWRPEDFSIAAFADLYTIFKPTREDWVLGKGGPKYNEPIAASHKSVRFPSWMSRIMLDANLGKDKQTDNTQTLEAAATAVPEAAQTASRYLRSSWMIASRAAVTANLSLIHSVPNYIQPLAVIRVKIGEQDMTGMVSGLSIKWTSGSKYNKTISLSHVTSVNDQYFRAITGGFVEDERDVLEIATDEFK